MSDGDEGFFLGHARLGVEGEPLLQGYDLGMQASTGLTPSALFDFGSGALRVF